MKVLSILVATALGATLRNDPDLGDECTSKCKRILQLQYQDCVTKPEEEQQQCLTMLAVAVGQCIKNNC